MSIRKSFDIEAARAIGSRIKDARGDTTQAEFARLIGVDRATLSNYETGRRIPNSDIIKAIEAVSGAAENHILLGAADGSDYIGAAIKDYQSEFVRQSQKHPGFYPKWFFSDFEVALLRCLRACPDQRKKKIVDMLVSEYKEFIDIVNVPFGEPLPEYEEQSLRMVEAASASGSFESGTDVERVLWSYFRRMTFTGPEDDGEGAQ